MSTTGFFTDATLCIGCKACEVACKEWNGVPADGYIWSGRSYDHTGALGHSTWRHVAFVERTRDGSPVWDFLSDVCKHCEHAGCLEACPTGSIVRTDGAHLVATLGLQDSIVIHTPDATLVANKHDEEAIREIVKELEARSWREYL